MACIRSFSTKGCSRNYPQGGGPQAPFCPGGGEDVLLTTCPRGGGGWGVTCPGDQGIFDP